MGRFLAIVRPSADTRVLDVGGLGLAWKLAGFPAGVTLLNVRPLTNSQAAGLPQVIGNARCLDYENHAFDVVFSNSMLEHIPNRADQVRASRELARVGRRLWVQTPARAFPIEPHCMTPFIHWLPRPWRRRLARLTLWALTSKPTTADLDRFASIRLLTHGELAAMFPGCVILRERFLGLTKSYIVVR